MSVKSFALEVVKACVLASVALGIEFTFFAIIGRGLGLFKRVGLV